MNIKNIHIFRILAALLLSVVVGSCSQDEMIIEHGETLPPGQYPLMFTATVDGMMSRSIESEPWVDGDEIAVQIDDYPAIGLYKLNPDGSVKKCDDPLSWPYEEGCVKAWFPSVELPYTKQISDQTEGFHNIDFLYAGTGTERYSNTIDLKFKHLMTKVKCNLSKGEGITDDDLATAKVSYYGFTKATFSETGLLGDENDGLITSTSDFAALLVPQDMSGKPFIKVELTVTVNEVPIPKTLIYTPEKLQLEAACSYIFNITVQKDRLVAQTVSGAWDDEKGPEYANQVLRRVNLNINLSEGEELDLSFSDNVTQVSGNTRAGNVPDYLLVKGKEFSISYDIKDTNHWKGLIPSVEDAGKLTMNCLRTKDVYTFTYKLVSDTVSFEYTNYAQVDDKYYWVADTLSFEYDEYVQVGDTYYDDGTWSRGQINGKTPIGIVFRTDLTGTDDEPGNYNNWGDKRRIRGYVVALKDASTQKGCWGKGIAGNSYVTTTFSESSTDPLKSIYSGYVNTNKIREKDPDGLYSASTVSATSTEYGHSRRPLIINPLHLLKKKKAADGIFHLSDN